MCVEDGPIEDEPLLWIKFSYSTPTNSASEPLKDNSHALYFKKVFKTLTEFTHIKHPLYGHLVKFLVNTLVHKNTLFIKNFLSLKYQHWLNPAQEECFFKWESENKIRSLQSS